MLKKPAVLGIAAFGFTTAIFAGGNYYDYSTSNDYAEAPVPIATAPPAAYSDAGFVIGVQGGYAKTHWSNLNNAYINFNDILSFSDDGFAARGYLGYDFNRFFGLEAGYTYLPKATSDFGNITNYALDILAKLSVQVVGGFSVHAKAGGSYFHSSIADGITDNFLLNNNSRGHFGPVFGVGAAYEIVPNFAIGLDWMRYSGNGKISSSSYQPNPDAVFLGLSYKFPMRVG